MLNYPYWENDDQSQLRSHTSLLQMKCNSRPLTSQRVFQQTHLVMKHRISGTCPVSNTKYTFLSLIKHAA